MQDCDEPDQESVPARLVSGLEENVTEMRAQEEMISRADNDERLKVNVIVCFGCIQLWFAQGLPLVCIPTHIQTFNFGLAWVRMW